MTSVDATSVLGDAAPPLAGLAPLARRVAALDATAVQRIRLGAGAAAGYAMPFGVLVGRTVRAAWGGPPVDWVVRALELAGWLDGEVGQPPQRRDAEWRGALPPSGGWRRVEWVPDEVVRGVVRQGASTLREAAERETMRRSQHTAQSRTAVADALVRSAQPRAAVADALLDSVVLTATGSTLRAEITLRAISALTRMGFMPPGSHVAIDVCGRWSRVAAEYGSVYVERTGLALVS